MVATAVEPELLDVEGVAKLLTISTRSVFRKADAGLIPMGFHHLFFPQLPVSERVTGGG